MYKNAEEMTETGRKMQNPALCLDYHLCKVSDWHFLSLFNMCLNPLLKLKYLIT